jgi:peptide/nickel transport system permease protein
MMVHDGYKTMTSEGAWYLLFFPSLSISILVLAFNLLGNGLRDAFDPKGNN